VASGELDEWIAVLSGNKERLRHVDYVTKQPGVDELKQNLSIEDARA
jgi:hypothetical protein